MSRTYKKKTYVWFLDGVPSWFKRMNRREERTKQEQSLREGKDLPVIKKRDAYDFW